MRAMRCIPIIVSIDRRKYALSLVQLLGLLFVHVFPCWEAQGFCQSKSPAAAGAHTFVIRMDASSDACPVMIDYALCNTYRLPRQLLSSRHACLCWQVSMVSLPPLNRPDYPIRTRRSSCFRQAASQFEDLCSTGDEVTAIEAQQARPNRARVQGLLVIQGITYWLTDLVPGR